MISLIPSRSTSADLADRVDRAIERGIEAILSKTAPHDVITYHLRNLRGDVTTVTGNVTRVLDGAIQFRTVEGKKLTIPRRLITSWKHAGYVESELPEAAFGGPTALAALALLSASVDPSNERMQRVIDALAFDDAKQAGTYVRSLRAGVWNLMLDRKLSVENKRRYFRILGQDAAWLMRAMGPNGAYDYGVNFVSGDNSNTQFANLGLWASSIGGIEISNRYWQSITEYWLKGQHPGGGWPYRDRGKPTPSMTVAGCNSLYIVLDRYYSKADRPYEYFRGASPNKRARKKMDQIYRAISDGNRYLELNPPDVRQTFGYELFGLERLGLASGQAQIGGVDWFRHHAGDVADHAWNNEVIADAFALIFLVHGGAPILFQKLEHGSDPNDWNYYHRDLHTLTRYLSATFERLHRWQRIPADASLESMEDAPFLYISGHDELILSEEIRGRIHAYVDRGGTVFLHADRRGKKFVDSATAIFESMFADRDLHFRELDPSHPLYTCHFGASDKDWKKHIPLQAISDGPRLLAILCPVDIAGAFHQDCRQFADLFKIMANIRVYCAPPYSELPRVIRRTPELPPAAPHRGSLRIKRWSFAGDWSAHRGVWQRQRDALERRTGISIDADETSTRLKPDHLSIMDMVHLSTRGAKRLNKSEVEELTHYLESGGLLLIESADGQSKGNAAVRALIDAIPIGEKSVLAMDHPLATGQFPGGQSILDLSTTQDGASLNRPNTPPPILVRTLNGRVIIAACPFDLSAALDGPFIWRRVGYTRESTLRIIDNFLLWRLHERGSGKR
ncbi:MAG: DUF4159 domain-containing protein [Planctomycetes bacterium]|nr:DUF4159 domain-containing protein [Planctomycetota bacterium]